MSAIALKQEQDCALRHDWTLEEVEALFAKPFMDLMFEAQTIHRQNFDANKIQVSKLLSIKTGSCPEDCTYCPQSAHYATGLEKEKLMAVEEVIESARKAKEEGASRFCMGAAWRGPREADLDVAIAMIEGVKSLGMQTCATFGLLDKFQAQRLKEAGLDYYNHNLDTSEDHYKKVITTRTYQDRLDTLENVREAGMHVCSGGIVGLGEGQTDRAKMLQTLANMPKHPDSVPINLLIAIPGTPLEKQERPDNFEFIRAIAVARIMMPKSYVRLSAGREGMTEEMQTLCFLAGANSIFCGAKLLTASNADPKSDKSLFGRLGLSPC